MTSMRRVLISCAAAIVTIVAAAAVPVAAHAGVYTVHQCKNYGGQPGPAPSVLGAFTDRSTVMNTCSSRRQGALLVGSAGRQSWTAKDGGAWYLVTPPDTRLSFVQFERQTRGLTGAYFVYLERAFAGDPRMPIDQRKLLECSYPGCRTEVSGVSPRYSALDDARRDIVTAAVVCDENGPGCAGWVNMAIYRFTAGYSDPSHPRIVNLGGSLLSASAVSGVRVAQLGAADTGGGVYFVDTRIDGRTPAPDVFARRSPRTILSSAKESCSDADTSNSDPFEFWHSQPCPLYAQPEIGIDTTKLRQGQHTIQFFVTDAAGNTTASPVRQFTVFNDDVARDRRVELQVDGFTARGTPTEIVRSARRPGSRRTRSGVTLRRWRVGPSRSTRPRIRGLLRSARGKRRPIGKAKLAVFVRDRGGRFRRKGDITTSRRGRFSYRLARGASRDVSFVYRGSSGRRGAIGEVSAAVKARVTINASPRSVLNGREVRFSGRVTSGSIPRRGVLVELRAFEDGRWRTFEQSRARGKRGRWSARYRFRTIRRGRRAFRFQARVRGQHGYPYATGTSRAIRVVVRGR